MLEDPGALEVRRRSQMLNKDPMVLLKKSVIGSSVRIGSWSLMSSVGSEIGSVRNSS